MQIDFISPQNSIRNRVWCRATLVQVNIYRQTTFFQFFFAQVAIKTTAYAKNDLLSSVAFLVLPTLCSTNQRAVTNVPENARLSINLHTKTFLMRLSLPSGLLLFFTAFASSIKAQTQVGIKLGLGLSMATVTSISRPNTTRSFRSSAGFVAGAFLQVPLKGHWSLQPGLQFSRKGINEDYTYRSNNTSYSYSTSDGVTYLELPLNIIHSFKEKHSGFFIGAGPVISFSKNSNQYSGFKSTDVGADVLLGYQTPIGFSINLSYTHGFTNAAAGIYAFSEWRNRFAALTVGYLF
jgi:hypothetical protein